jgi:hypothetical protein
MTENLGLLLTCCFNSGYNPPKFVIDAAKDALNRVDCNQYSPTKARAQMKHNTPAKW